MSYDRMPEEEARLKQEIATILAEAESADATEDAAHGPGRRGDELPQELARRQSRLVKIQEAKAQLEGRARTEAAEEAARRREEGKAPPAVAPAEAVPGAKDQINFTDPESRIMKVSNKGWDQCGNAQAVANEHQIILAADVTHQTNDKRQAVPMVDQTQANLKAAGVKQAIGAAVMDSGGSWGEVGDRVFPGAHRSAVIGGVALVGSRRSNRSRPWTSLSRACGTKTPATPSSSAGCTPTAWPARSAGRATA
jgi:hypothetical protein